MRCRLLRSARFVLLVGPLAVAAGAGLPWQTLGPYGSRPPEAGLPEACLRCVARPLLLLGLQEQTREVWSGGAVTSGTPSTAKVS